MPCSDIYHGYKYYQRTNLGPQCNSPKDRQKRKQETQHLAALLLCVNQCSVPLTGTCQGLLAKQAHT